MNTHDYLADYGISDLDIIKVLRKTLAEDNGEAEAKRKQRARKAKADFFNLNEVVKTQDAIFF